MLLPGESPTAPIGPEQEPSVADYEQFLGVMGDYYQSRLNDTQRMIESGHGGMGINDDPVTQAKLGELKVARERLGQDNCGLVGRLVARRIAELYETIAECSSMLEDYPDLSSQEVENLRSYMDAHQGVADKYTPLEVYARRRYLELREQHRREQA